MSSLTFQSTLRLSSGNQIPRLGFGAAFNFGKAEDVAAVSKPSLLEALRVGYRHIDTAQMYNNEIYVGQAVREFGLKREDVFITSKVPSTSQDGLAAVDASLKDLGLDYIDLYLIHSPPRGKDARLKLWREILAAKKAGKIRSAGVSNFNERQLEEIKSAGLELPSVNQVELHPLCKQRPIVNYCNANSIAIEAYCPIIRGRLDNQQLDPKFASLHKLVDSLAKKYERDYAQILLRWSLQKGFIPLVRSSNPARIASNAQIYDFDLTDEEVDALDALDDENGHISWNPVNVE
ncbi:Aldo/keto reductase [Cristinia sonorae]|uniref:Aldo/keto reductase n=1 Tax=Cristinia sonorae TaxID=1940300 RepID=A0A8K0UQU6_9AGAR|nr:Aldo/keto reductase [Cristinia sonorae]